MKYFILISILSIFTHFNNLIAQDAKKNLRFKVYANANYQRERDAPDLYYSYGFSEDYRAYDISNISLAMEWNVNKRLTHEVELMPIDFWREQFEAYNSYLIYDRIYTYSDQITMASLYSYARYQLLYHIILDRKVQPYLGIAGRCSYKYMKWEQESSLQFSQPGIHVPGIRFDAVSGIFWQINERLGVNADILFGLYSFKYIKSEPIKQSYYAENGLTIQEQVYYISLPKTLENYFPDSYYLRLGASYTF